MLRTLWGSFVLALLQPRWVVSEPEECEEGGELGIRLLGINFWYYKWPDPMVAPGRQWRHANKREFGETILSENNISHVEIS